MNKQTTRFPALLTIGALGLAVNTLVLMLLREQTGMPLILASLLAGETALVHNYLLHSAFTFQQRAANVRHLVLFHGMALATLVFASLLLLAFVHFVGLAYPLANVLAVGVASTANYLLIARWLWPTLPVDTEPAPLPERLRTNGRRVLGYALGAAAGLVLLGVTMWFANGQLVSYVVLGLSIVLLAQSLFSLYLMLYSWEHPARLEASRGPTSYEPPQHSFTVLLPARHEEAVIYQTIRRVWAANYPRELLEVVVVCHADDGDTIREAERAIAGIGSPRVRVETFDRGPINKPRGLNVGLRRTHNEIVTIFDAEDDIHPEIFNCVNTIMLREHVGAVQGGVQLMNFTDHWFSSHNCLEYFFWFKSRLHFHAQQRMIPLGGNTVFVRRDLLEQVGGWDEQCLTEDAEVGIRLSALGEPIRVVYDAQYVTREETPDTVGQFVKQRTRWHQGFLQVLRKGEWRKLPTLPQRLLAVYTLSYPLFQALLVLLWPAMVLSALWLKLPVGVTIVAFLPLYALGLQFLVSVIGAWMFTREYRLRFPLLLPIGMALTYIPFQLLLGVSAVRAVWREARREQGWEKTRHVGAHRRAG